MSEVASLAGGLVSGASSLVGGLLTNETNEEIASSNNSQLIELANTAHQREVKDLKAAGLNPILSATGSGATTPNMQTPVISNVMGQAADQAITNFSAVQTARQTESAIDVQLSQRKLNEANALLAAANAASALSLARNTDARTERERWGKFGSLAGTKASELTDKLYNVVSDVFSSSAKKVSPLGGPLSFKSVSSPSDDLPYTGSH